MGKSFVGRRDSIESIVLENNRYGASESSDYITFYKYNLISYTDTDFTIKTVYGNILVFFLQ